MMGSDQGFCRCADCPQEEAICRQKVCDALEELEITDFKGLSELLGAPPNEDEKPVPTLD
jgi:hypothetical protein